MLAPAEIVLVNLSTYRLQILNPDHSLKREGIVSRSTVWRLLKMWAKTPEEWRNLEWNIDHECVVRFRHRRKIKLKGIMTWEQYHQYCSKGNEYE